MNNPDKPVRVLEKPLGAPDWQYEHLADFPSAVDAIQYIIGCRTDPAREQRLELLVTSPHNGRPAEGA